MISRIGHVGLQVPDLEWSVAHAEQILGLREVKRDGKTAYLTCNERHHELVLQQDSEVGCYFCYFLDEDGAIVEYSADMYRVENEATYQARTWPDEPLSVNRWGNPPPPWAFTNGRTSLVQVTASQGS